MKTLKKAVKRVLPPSLLTRILWKQGIRAGNFNLRLINHIVKPGMIIVDVGASDGLFSARMLQLTGKAGHVYGVEPHPDNEASLAPLHKRHPQFDYFMCAASNVNAVSELHVPIAKGVTHTGLSSLRTPSQGDAMQEIVVELKTLDSLLQDEERPISFIKIDVEGHELAVLKGAARVLASKPVLLIEIEKRHCDGSIVDTFDFLLNSGYDGWALFRDGLRPIERFNLERDQTAFVDDRFQDVMPLSYVNDFLFVEKGKLPPTELMDRCPSDASEPTDGLDPPMTEL